MEVFISFCFISIRRHRKWNYVRYKILFPLDFGKYGTLTEEPLEDKNCLSIPAVKPGMLSQALSKNVVMTELFFDKVHSLIISTPKTVNNIKFT